MVSKLQKAIHAGSWMLRLPRSLDGLAEQMQMSLREREYIADILRSKKSLLELGSGYSTVWFSQFAGHIVSVESREEWFKKVHRLLDRYHVTNVELYLLPPEPCAYDDRGKEKWNNRDTPEGSDYGTTEEFLGYLQGIEDLLTKTDFDVVLVDGQVREMVVRMLLRRHYNGVILLHDVMPERDYLNQPIMTMHGLKIVDQIETLVELTVGSN